MFNLEYMFGGDVNSDRFAEWMTLEADYYINSNDFKAK
jgi:hypothetical protein